ncbi:SLC13 family permease [Shigella flexneri]
MCALPINRLIIFEALAVNAGSLLTPIGNPQNILLWGRSGLSFPALLANAAACAGDDGDAAGAVLVLFPGKSAAISKQCTRQAGNRGSCGRLGLYLVFLAALEMKQELAGGDGCGGFLLLARRVVFSVDWTLLLVFMAMFIDVHLLIRLPVLQCVHPCRERSLPTRAVADGDWFVAGY